MEQVEKSQSQQKIVQQKSFLTFTQISLQKLLGYCLCTNTPAPRPLVRLVCIQATIVPSLVVGSSVQFLFPDILLFALCILDIWILDSAHSIFLFSTCLLLCVSQTCTLVRLLSL